MALVACAALVGFVAFAVVSALTRHATGSFPAVPPPSELRVGERAPTFDLSRLGGGAPVVFGSRSAEPVVVNFFASWCANCVAELHAFASVSSHATATRFVGVDSSDANSTAAEGLLRHAGISYPVGVDRSGVTASHYLVAALPVTFFIDARGLVRGEIFGAVTAEQLRAWVDRLREGGQ